MYGELWWTRMINAVRFLEDITGSLISGKSVVLNFAGDIPCRDIMIDTIGKELETVSDNRSFEVYDKPHTKNPGEFILERNYSDSERKKYWPPTHNSYERFMAMNRNTPLIHKYMCITGISSGEAAMWVKSVTEYLECCEAETEHGMFILVTQGANVRSSEYMDCYQYTDYVTDYDCLVLCLTMLSSLDCAGTEKQYISELANTLSGNNIEFAGKLVSYERELAKSPEKCAGAVLGELYDSEQKLKEFINSAVWEAQIKIVFPKLEMYRSDMIKKYSKKIQKHLPIIGSDGKRVDKAEDLEINELHTLCYSKKITDSGDSEFLKKMRDTRNSLAHWNPVSYDVLVKLGIFKK